MKRNPHVNKVLKQVLQHIRDGADVIDATRKFDEGIEDLFTRRYKLTFVKRLKEKGSWERDKEKVFHAAEMHGVIAAAAAQFSQPGVITQTVFMRAAHVMELSCYEYVTAGQARRREKNKPLFGGPWCW
jgi:hypothetical protein